MMIFILFNDFLCQQLTVDCFEIIAKKQGPRICALVIPIDPAQSLQR